jgi:hypothetical protein
MYRFLYVTRSYSFRGIIVCSLSPSRSRSHITTEGQSASSSWCLVPLGAGDQMLHLFEWQLLFYFSCRAPSRQRGRSVICSQMTQVQFQVTLRPTVCRPVRLEPEFNLFVWQLLRLLGVGLPPPQIPHEQGDPVKSQSYVSAGWKF